MNYDSALSASDVALLQGRNNDGFGDGNGWWIILFLIVLFGGWGNRGFGGFGGNGTNGSTSVYEGYVLSNDFSQLSKSMSDYYQMTERKLDGINNGLCDGFYAQNTNLLNGFSGVNQNIAAGVSGIQNTLTQGFAGLNTGMVQQGYETRLGTQNLASQLASCCCDIRQQISDVGCTTNRNIDAVNYNMATNTNILNNAINSGFVGVQQSMCLNTRDIIDSQRDGTKAILDAITANRIEDKNNQIAMLQTQLNNAELRASQEGQTREIINTIRPCPIPAYQSCNPWGCNCNQGCGCNC